VHAGLDEFTYLDKIDGWVIERRIDSNTNKVFCRASIPFDGNWFSVRTRLNQDGSLVIPSDLSHAELTSHKVITKVKAKLKTCRSGLIYLPINKSIE